MSLLFALILQTALAKDDVEVIFFGGHRTTAQDMACWEKGARKDKQFGSYKFRGIAYPANGPAVASARAIQQAGKTEVDDVLRYLRAHKDKHIVLVGHSNGSALANAVAARGVNPGRLELINLDGYVPDRSVQDRVDTTCYYAKGAGGAVGFMTNSIKSKCENAKPLADNHCSSKHCLHFSLINKSAPPGLSKATYGKEGYRGCNTNLAWLQKGGGAAPAQVASAGASR